MSSFTAVDPDFESRIRASFGAQKVMQTLGARLERVVPGEVRIGLRFNPALTQQHGFLHAGVLGIIVDSACGYAAYTLMPAATEVLSVEYKTLLSKIISV
jgi:acyl-coenzyme A thioesterase PaaI-like protein